MAAKTNGGRDIGSELAFLTRALKAPSLAAAIPRLAERAAAESWSHEGFLAACLQREVAARESHGGEGRILYVRSMHGRAGAWFRGTQTRSQGHVRSAGIGKDVTFVNDTDPQLNDRLDAAYRTKYARYGNSRLMPGFRKFPCDLRALRQSITVVDLIAVPH